MIFAGARARAGPALIDSLGAHQKDLRPHGSVIRLGVRAEYSIAFWRDSRVSCFRHLVSLFQLPSAGSAGLRYLAPRGWTWRGRGPWSESVRGSITARVAIIPKSRLARGVCPEPINTTPDGDR